MKYICLGYLEEKMWEAMSENEQKRFIDECLTYDDELRKNGHMVGGEALQGARTATTVRYKSGRLSITDGPFAETKEQLAGFYLIEARDLNEAIQVAGKIPPAREGSVEVRPVRELDV